MMPHLGTMWGGWGGPFVGILLWIVGILGIVLLLKWILAEKGGQVGHLPGEQSAMAIPMERFARGEIDMAEFEERRQALLS